MKKKIFILIAIVLIVLSIVAIFIYKNMKDNIENKLQSNIRDNNVKQVEIISDYINIRSNNSTESNIIGKVYKGEIYTVVETKDLWIKINTSKGIDGWIISSYNSSNYVKYLEVEGSIPEEQVKLDKIANNEYIDFNNIKYRKVEWISDVPLNEIKTIKDNGMMNIQPKMFITNSGDLYEFSTEKRYSNEQVCKKVDTNEKFDRFDLFANDRDLSLIISSNDKYYYYIDGEFKNYFVDDSLIHKVNNEHRINYGHYEGGSENYRIYYYIDNNDIYEYKFKINNGSFETISNEIIDTIPAEEKFISLEGRILKTDKSYYKLGVKNQEECNKYEDVEPVFGLVKLEQISNDYKLIKYFNGNYIIYNDDPNNLYIYSENYF